MLIPPKKTERKTTALDPVKIDLQTYKIDLGRQDIKQDVCITIQQKTVLTLGSLAILTGKPKARKTSFLHAFLSSAIIKQSIWTIDVQLPPERPQIALIDTEQSLFDLFTSLARLSAMTGIKLTDLKNFFVYSARAADVVQIMELISTICEQNPKISLIAIDGIIDLVNDINDVREAKNAINFLKKICDTYNVAIIGIIHQNKGTNYSLGHLGSFASRFAQSEFSIEKNEDNTSTLKATFLRSADDIQPINIGYDERNNCYDILENINNNNFKIDINLTEKIFAGAVGLTYKNLVSKIKIETGLNNYQVEKKIIPVMYAEKLIHKVGQLIQIYRLP